MPTQNDTFPLIIRAATRADLPALEWDGVYTHFRRLFQHAFEQTQRGEIGMYLAEVPGKGIVGQVFVQYDSLRPEMADGCTRAYVYSFRVKPAYRNRGIGTRLMQTVETDLKKRGFTRVTLNVARDNPDARRLYERLGYRVVGSDPGHWSYLDHEGHRRFVSEPAWRMEKTL
ncbi:MAG: GNAT family N-acetyltransferase [Anaerolineae bacterium]|nr:MAG: GNAT family N-acetyltransferase [Anaerolineae bacterium]